MEPIIVFILIVSAVLSGVSFIAIYKYIELNRVHGIMIRAAQQATLNTFQKIEEYVELDDDEVVMLKYILQRNWENDSQIVLPFE